MYKKYKCERNSYLAYVEEIGKIYTVKVANI